MTSNHSTVKTCPFTSTDSDWWSPPSTLFQVFHPLFICLFRPVISEIQQDKLFCWLLSHGGNLCLTSVSLRIACRLWLDVTVRLAVKGSDWFDWQRAQPASYHNVPIPSICAAPADGNTQTRTPTFDKLLQRVFFIWDTYKRNLVKDSGFCTPPQSTHHVVNESGLSLAEDDD